MKDEVYIERIKAGREWMGHQVFKETRSSARYQTMQGDPTNTSSSIDVGQALGQINYPAINIRQKVSAISYTCPDFSVVCEDGENSEVVRQVMKRHWSRMSHMRAMRRTLMRRLLSGISWVAYLWDEKDGFVVEHVRARDLSVDPHTKDESWQNLRWAARRIVLPAWVAEQKYPGITLRSGVKLDPKSDASDRIEVWTYWDDTHEVEVCEDEILEVRPNLYGEVPICTLQGGIDPEREFGTGDYDEISGAAELLRRLQNLMNDAATHHGGYFWVQAEALDEPVKNALMRGNYRGPVPVNGVSGNEAMGYIPAMPLNPAVMDAMRYVSNGIDADQGVPQYSRGVVSQPAKFATEAMLLQGTSGARGSESRAEYEDFCSRVAERHVYCMREFGRPDVDGEDVWRAFADVLEVRIVEESASFRDPAAEQQAAIALFQQVTAVYPLFLQAAQAGMIQEVPNLWEFLDDVMRKFRKRELDKYRTPIVGMAPPPDPMAPGAMPSPDAMAPGQEASQTPLRPSPEAMAQLIGGQQ